MKENKTVILILGMHRSGTSAMGGVLHTLGINMGDNLFHATEDNKKGYYEDKDIVQLNEKLFYMLTSSWHDIFLLEDNWWNDEKFKSIENEALELIKNKLGNNSTIGIKDPRMCILFPFWENIFHTLALDIKCIYIFRHPIEVAKSLEKRNGFSEAKSILLWLKYNYYALKYIQNYQNVIISYPQLFTDLSTKLTQCYKVFGISYFENYIKVKDDLLSFIDKSLHRNIIKADKQNPKIAFDLYTQLKAYSDEDICNLNNTILLSKEDIHALLYQDINILTDLLRDYHNIQEENIHLNNKLYELRKEVHKRTDWALTLKEKLYKCESSKSKTQTKQ
ncbi:hypothetical protein KKA17_12280 [bacterium]|nr:hypothetical protein [bacterium]MBU1884500.1 hypothetical protein [bacterium]